MKDHLDEMPHEELAKRTRELLEAVKSVTGKSLTMGWHHVDKAIAALQPTPLDKLRQTLREQGCVNSGVSIPREEAYFIEISNGDRSCVEHWFLKKGIES